jgi:hypothetical protein
MAGSDCLEEVLFAVPAVLESLSGDDARLDNFGGTGGSGGWLKELALLAIVGKLFFRNK